MNLKNLLRGVLFLSVFASASIFADENFRVGVVDFGACVGKSYLGQQENSKWESMRSEMITMIEAKQKELQEIADKLNNSDYMDTITAEAEKELEMKARTLSEELQLLGNQSDQALQQASNKIMQNLKSEVDKACEYIAREKNFDYILNKDTCFYFKRPTDITPLVIQEMNRHYQPEETAKNEK